MATTKIRLITERGLDQSKETLRMTNDPVRKAEVAEEVAEMQRHFDAKNAVIAMASKEGFRRNSYEGTCVKTGEQVQPNCGFVRKEDGAWKTYSFATVQEIVAYQFEG